MNDFERDSYALAMDLEAVGHNHNAAVVVKACYWLLAGLIVQASKAGERSLDEALRICCEQLTVCVAQLASDGEGTRVQ